MEAKVQEAENQKIDVLCYNLPPIENQYLDALQRHLKTVNVTVVEKGPSDGDVVSLLQGPLAHCKVVEIDRTDRKHAGLDGLQEARRSTALRVRVIAFGIHDYHDVLPEVDLGQAESSVFHCHG